MVTHEILDSKFCANRTGLRTWRELRFIGQAMWSREEEDKLRRECLGLLDYATPWTPPSISNATLWAAAFDRYGVPLSDLFTYGLKLHPSSTRGFRAKYITSMCCQSLIVIMVHPIFQAKIDLVRYVLQRIICLRMGIHQPPVGPAAGIDDTANSTIDATAEILYNEDPWVGQTEAYHGALWLYIQEFGIQTHPEIVNLVEAITAAFKNVNKNNIPSDNTPHCRNLFFLQLWDLQFLVQVLDNIARPRGYLPTEQYHRQWLRVTRRVRPYIESKIDNLVEDWFLLDERNHRVRQKLIARRSGRPIYDIGEEDFRPLYAKSGLITVGMRSILCGDYLEPLCAPERVDAMNIEMQDDVPVNVQDQIAVNEMTENSMGIEMQDDVPVNVQDQIAANEAIEDAMDIEMQDNGPVEVQDEIVVVIANRMHKDDTVSEMKEGATVNKMQEDATVHDLQKDVTVSEKQGTEIQSTHNDIDSQQTEDDLEMQGTYNNIATQGLDDGTDVESTEDNAVIHPNNFPDLDDSDEYEPSNSGDDDDDDDYETVRTRRTRRRRRSVSSSGSIASFHSISSSKADEWEPVDDEAPRPLNEHIARRGLPEQARNKPAFRRRLGWD